MTAYFVYRALDSEGEVLYVGCTRNLAQRLGEHGRTAPWADQVAKVRATVHPDRTTALAVEREEIARLSPVWNYQGQWASNATWTDADFARYLTVRGIRAGRSDVVRRHLRNVRRIRNERFPVAS